MYLKRVMNELHILVQREGDATRLLIKKECDELDKDIIEVMNMLDKAHQATHCWSAHN